MSILWWVGTTADRGGDPKDRHAEDPCDVAGKPRIRIRQGEHHYVEPLTSDGVPDCLQHVLVGSDDPTHRLTGIDEGCDLGRDRVVLRGIIEDNQ
jgi:hypothetical protein